MRNQTTRIVLIVIAVALSLVFLWPTFQDYRFRKQIASLRGADSLSFVEQNQDAMSKAKLKRVKLGLDLQGGMRVVLEVDVIQLLSDVGKNKDDNFNSIVAEVRKESATTDESVIPMLAKKFQDRGIRMSRYYGSNIREEDAGVVAYLQSETEKAIDRAIEVVRNRVDQYRVSEPNIQKQGSRRIIVELPGVKDENEVRQLLQGTALLEFKLLKDPQIAYKVMESIDKYLSGKTDTTIADTSKGKKAKTATATPKKQVDALSELLGGSAPTETDTTSEAKFQRENPFFYYVRPDQRGSGDGYVEAKNRDRVIALLARAEIQRIVPPDMEFSWSAKAVTDPSGKQFYQIFPLKKNAELTGAVISDARSSISPEDGRPVVNMEMNSEGAREWARITGANIQKRVAIVLDKAVFSAPVVQNKITGGRSQISNIDSPNEARLLEIVLRAGALPAPVAIIEQRSVGPSLGEDSIRSGFNSFTIAFVFTILFMIFYYHNAGGIADFALLFNVLFIMGVLAAFQATLTLPGIAGVVLTLGMAVDANVLINERIREELAGGKTVRAAVEAGYAKAFAAIFDSNITTMLTGIVLYQFGTGPIQGFALTLMIGIAASMFSAIIITHVIFNILTDKGMNPNFG